jgi:hypothetical protein
MAQPEHRGAWGNIAAELSTLNHSCGKHLFNAIADFDSLVFSNDEEVKATAPRIRSRRRLSSR